MSAGDTVALCKGGKFTSNASGWWDWTNFNCTAANTCDLRDYTPPWGGTARPIVDASNGASVFFITGGGSLVDGYRILNLKLVGANDGGASDDRAFGFGRDLSDLEVCNVVMDGFSIAIEAQLDGCTNIPAGGGRRRHFRGNQIVNSSHQGVLYDGFDSDFDGNYFDNNAWNAANRCGGGPTGHTWYLTSCGAQNVRFINNEIRNNAVYRGYPQGSAAKIDGTTSGSVFENNYIVTGSNPLNCSSGALFGSASYGAGHKNVTVRRNRIVGGEGTQIGFSAADHVLIESNIVIANTSSDANGGDLIAAPHEWSASPAIKATIRNNTVYMTNVSTASGRAGISVGGNAAASSGSILTGNSVVILNESGNGSACYRVEYPSKLSVMSHNHCYGVLTRFGRSGGNDYALGAWQVFTGKDGNSITGDPLFVNAPADLTPQVGSPLLGGANPSSTCTVAAVANQPCFSPVAIGTPVWSATDLAKNRDLAPDIGAVER